MYFIERNGSFPILLVYLSFLLLLPSLAPSPTSVNSPEEMTKEAKGQEMSMLTGEESHDSHRFWAEERAAGWGEIVAHAFRCMMERVQQIGWPCCGLFWWGHTCMCSVTGNRSDNSIVSGNTHSNSHLHDDWNPHYPLYTFLISPT